MLIGRRFFGKFISSRLVCNFVCDFLVCFEFMFWKCCRYFFFKVDEFFWVVKITFFFLFKKKKKEFGGVLVGKFIR